MQTLKIPPSANFKNSPKCIFSFGGISIKQRKIGLFQRSKIPPSANSKIQHSEKSGFFSLKNSPKCKKSGRLTEEPPTRIRSNIAIFGTLATKKIFPQVYFHLGEFTIFARAFVGIIFPQVQTFKIPQIANSPFSACQLYRRNQNPSRVGKIFLPKN